MGVSAFSFTFPVFITRLSQASEAMVSTGASGLETSTLAFPLTLTEGLLLRKTMRLTVCVPIRDRRMMEQRLRNGRTADSLTATMGKAPSANVPAL